MNQKAKVAVVILNWNGKLLLEKFLPSVLKSTYSNLEIVVGDNASTDGSADYIKMHFPTVTCIKNDENYGYAAGYNRILEHVYADYFVLLNSDVEVTPEWIEPIIELMEKSSEVGICQPKIINYHAKNYFEYAGASGGFIDIFGYPFCRGRIFDQLEKDEGQYDEVKEIFWASGAALFIRSDLYKQSGGLDPYFFAHMEEVDLCWRVKNMGYKIMVCPRSVVFHVGGGTLPVNNPNKTYFNFRNSLIMLRKNLPFHQALGIIIIRHFLDLIAWIRFLLTGKFKHAFAINKAHYHFLITHPQWTEKRKQLLKLFKNPNKSGLYKRSIVFDYFVRNKKHFSELSNRDFL